MPGPGIVGRPLTSRWISETEIFTTSSEPRSFRDSVRRSPDPTDSGERASKETRTICNRSPLVPGSNSGDLDSPAPDSPVLGVASFSADSAEFFLAAATFNSPLDPALMSGDPDSPVFEPRRPGTVSLVADDSITSLAGALLDFDSLLGGSMVGPSSSKEGALSPCRNGGAIQICPNPASRHRPTAALAGRASVMGSSSSKLRTLPTSIVCRSMSRARSLPFQGAWRRKDMALSPPTKEAGGKPSILWSGTALGTPNSSTSARSESARTRNRPLVPFGIGAGPLRALSRQHRYSPP